MKNKYIFQWLCLCFLAMPLTILAQTTRITFPINGMVFQQNASGTADVPLSVHISGIDATNPDYTTFGYAYYIERLNSQTGRTGQMLVLLAPTAMPEKPKRHHQHQSKKKQTV